MKKKVFAFVMAAVMVFTMAACGNNDTPANTDADGADSVIRIGGIGPLTGSYANYGISVKNGGSRGGGDQCQRRHQRYADRAAVPGFSG